MDKLGSRQYWRLSLSVVGKPVKGISVRDLRGMVPFYTHTSGD